ncbi:MAG: glycosyltransferase family 4 protein, partial [Candidatus Magasanikbacteria bacterium]|nr:glycosyltransferase family 4 protein [Candidatus Magasanikbacteria bacterium]
TRAPSWKGLFFKYYGKFWMPRILRSADKLITSSFDYLENSDAGFLYKENPDKWLELPFGVDLEKFKPRERPEALLKKHQLSPDSPIILFVGAMDAAHYFKGVSVLLTALRFLKDNNTPVQCVFVGEGSLREDFETQAKFSGLEKFVKFVGKVSDEELPYYYNLADLFVLPSINQGEAFGMVLLEAMASGVPAVATDLPGVRTVAQDAGVVVKPNDPGELANAISGYFSNQEGIPEWQAKARQVAEEKYDWGKIVSKLSDVYEGFAGK